MTGRHVDEPDHEKAHGDDANDVHAHVHIPEAHAPAYERAFAPFYERALARQLVCRAEDEAQAEKSLAEEKECESGPGRAHV